MATTHGVTTREVSADVFAVRESQSAVPFIVGTAPKGGPNSLEKVTSYQDFIDKFGQRQSQDDAWDFTLARFAQLHFQKYGSQPALMVAVNDPATTASVTDESQTFENNELTTANAHISNVVVTDSGGGTTYTEGSDYEVDGPTGTITRIDSGTISQGESVLISYDYVDPTGVTASDIVGGTDADGNRQGLELIEEAYVQHSTLPTLILAPGWSYQTSVATAIEGKAGGFSGGFKALGLIDIDSSDTNYDEVSEATSEKTNLTTSQHMAVFWPRITSGDDTDWLSAHAAGVIARTDRDRGGGLPYFSPSNKDLSADGTEVPVTFADAQTLSDSGLVTAINADGWQLWNNNTAAYPGDTDVKDRFIANRRMATHIENTLILSIFQKVDEPGNVRLITSIINSLNQTFSGWEAQGALLGADVLFRDQDNTTADLLDGKYTFRILYAVPTPAEQIEFVLKVDTDLYDNLFQ